MMSNHSAIYTGSVRHRRLEPVKHEFSYRIFMLYLDLEELPELFDHCWFWSARRPALAWMRRKDYLAPDTASLREAVLDLVARRTGEYLNGPVRLLTNLRYFGIRMNPISCYYCFDRQQQLRYIVAEVTNTPWRERIHYVIPATPSSSRTRYRFAKRLHVSPFMPMDLTYHWHSTVPGEQLRVSLQSRRANERLLHATLALERQPATPANLNRMLVTYPWMTARIGLAIYWQALRLALKRVPFHRHREMRAMDEVDQRYDREGEP